MASTYSNSLRLELMATGEKNATWGDITNTNLGTLLEQAIAGWVNVVHDDTTSYTLAATNGASDEARNMVLNISGTLTAARNVICPTQEKLYVVRNATSGNWGITLKTSGGTGVLVPPGTAMLVYCNGADCVQGLSAISSEFRLYDATDPTKLAAFNLAGITAGNTRTLTVPDGSTTIVGTDTTQTLTNKTLTSPTVSAGTFTSPTINTPTISTPAITGGTLSGAAINTTSIVLEQGAAPANVAEGRIQWDTDDDKIIVGDGTTTKEFLDKTKVLQAANNLSDLTNAATARANLGVTSTSAASASEIWAATDNTKMITPAAMSAALAEITLTDGATVTVDFSTGINFVLTIGGNRTLAFAAITSAMVGRSGYIRVIQDGTGSRTLDMSDAKIRTVNGEAPVLSTTAAAQDMLFYTIYTTSRIAFSMMRNIS